MPGPPPRKKGAAPREWLPEHLKHNPDLTLQEESIARLSRRRAEAR